MKTSWDLTHLYKNDDEWFKDYELLNIKMKKLSKEIEDLQIDAKSLECFIVSKCDCEILIQKLYCYAKRHLDINCTLLNYKDMMQKILEFYDKFQKINNRFEKVIIDNSKIIESLLTTKELKKYKRYINMIIRRKDHIKNSKVEFYLKDMHAIRDSYQQLFSFDVNFEDVIIDGKKYELNRKNYNELITNEKQENRKTIFDTYTNGYKKVNKKIANLYIEKLKIDIKQSKDENYNNLLEKYLFELELPNQILDNLINVINKSLNIMHEYTYLRKNLTGLNKYHIYDTSVSICNIPKIKYSLEETIIIIKKGLNVLGNDYISLIDKMFDEGWIDIFPKDNKRTMSFTCISYVGVPYVLVNFDGSINFIRTLSHEIGHAAHTQFSKENNNFVYFEFSSFLTEIVSKINEILINEYMIEHSKNIEEKKYILNNIISSMGNSLFGQVMLTEFEHNVINKLGEENIDCDYLNNLYFELSQKYNGKYLEYDDAIKYGWSKVPHFIMQDTYYLYQYSIGTAIATNVAYRILNKEENIVSKYKRFLSLGSSISILDALKYIDIDLTDSSYIENVIKVLEDKIKIMKSFT